MFDLQLPLVEVATFVGVSGLVLALLCAHYFKDRRLGNRMDALSRELPAGPTAGGPRRGLRSFIRSAVPRVVPRLVPSDQLHRTRLQSRLVQAGVYGPSAPYLFVVVRMLLMTTPVLLGVLAAWTGWIDMRRALLSGSIAGGVGMLLPGVWLDRRVARRQMLLGRAIPDFLDLLVTCLESGLSLDAGLRRVIPEMNVAHPVLADELERVQKEIDLGATADAALQSMAERSGVETIRTLGAFVQQARRIGTRTAEALRAHADGLRLQREQRAEELAQKAAVKILFPTLLCIFPAVFVVLAGPAAIQLHARFSQQAAQAQPSSTMSQQRAR